MSNPIYTPAEPTKSVSLELSDYAVLKATDSFKPGEAIVQLGGKDPANDTATNGSNYSLEGGIIDGSGIANGISINTPTTQHSEQKSDSMQLSQTLKQDLPMIAKILFLMSKNQAETEL
ncbi:MAG: hypothetical protein E7557_09060 [Ruminococcaceae bacterium]|nr:hypothetical protein [Oscillospiraceae bacterium]